MDPISIRYWIFDRSGTFWICYDMCSVSAWSLFTLDRQWVCVLEIPMPEIGKMTWKIIYYASVVRLTPCFCYCFSLTWWKINFRIELGKLFTWIQFGSDNIFVIGTVEDKETHVINESDREMCNKNKTKWRLQQIIYFYYVINWRPLNIYCVPDIPAVLLLSFRCMRFLLGFLSLFENYVFLCGHVYTTITQITIEIYDKTVESKWYSWFVIAENLKMFAQTLDCSSRCFISVLGE